MKPFLSTLSLRRATVKLFHQNYECFISIHALLAESDLNQIPQRGFHYHFYPRSPCGERLYSLYLLLLSVIFLSTLSLRRATLIQLIWKPGNVLFLSTLSLRRATRVKSGQQRSPYNFYPRSPCGERQLLHPSCTAKIHFYPRSPCGERPPRVLRHCTTYLFLSTLSLRRATIIPGAGNNPIRISIHALLAESDS